MKCYHCGGKIRKEYGDVRWFHFDASGIWLFCSMEFDRGPTAEPEYGQVTV